ncbi:hypothetical protein PQX77_005356 [Marasmius sp. AFHP31]|nr:hypothetical protein PQX77_005356 [Marasmius sp. AFHP31]
MNRTRNHSPRRSRIPGALGEMRVAVQAVINDREQSKKILQARGDEAQQCLDALQVLTELPDVEIKLRTSILRMMLHLSKRSGLCPSCLNINDVKRIGEHPIDGGGFGDVWMGEIENYLVCLKVVKLYLISDVQKLLKEYMREAIVWKQLRHPNLLPFIGMYYLDEARQQLCLVSPWMDRGNLAQYLKSTERKLVDHQTLVYDVASGLAHLHSMNIVHGDLKGVNVLMTADERACITDFGLSRVANTQSFCLTSSLMGQARGTIRWLSPELLKSDPPSSVTMSSDVYAYACVCYEIFTGGNKPFCELSDGAVIVTVVVDKEHPSRPSEAHELTDEMWEVMVTCWNHDAQCRPKATDVCSRVGGFCSKKTREPVQAYPAPEWDSLTTARVWKHVDYPSVDAVAIVRFLQKGLSPPSFPASDPTYLVGDVANTTRAHALPQPPVVDITTIQPLPSPPTNHRDMCRVTLSNQSVRGVSFLTLVTPSSTTSLNAFAPLPASELLGAPYEAVESDASLPPAYNSSSTITSMSGVPTVSNQGMREIPPPTLITPSSPTSLDAFLPSPSSKPLGVSSEAAQSVSSHPSTLNPSYAINDHMCRAPTASKQSLRGVSPLVLITPSSPTSLDAFTQTLSCLPLSRL